MRGFCYIVVYSVVIFRLYGIRMVLLNQCGYDELIDGSNRLAPGT